MGIIVKMRKQKACYWARGTQDATGKYTFTSATEIDCRWEDTQVLYRTKEGDEFRTSAAVYVDRDTPVGGYLWLGSLTSVPVGNLTEPRTLPGAFPIKDFLRTPNLKNTQVLRKAVL